MNVGVPRLGPFHGPPDSPTAGDFVPDSPRSRASSRRSSRSPSPERRPLTPRTEEELMVTRLSHDTERMRHEAEYLLDERRAAGLEMPGPAARERANSPPKPQAYRGERQRPERSPPPIQYSGMHTSPHHSSVHHTSPHNRPPPPAQSSYMLPPPRALPSPTHFAPSESPLYERHARMRAERDRAREAEAAAAVSAGLPLPRSPPRTPARSPPRPPQPGGRGGTPATPMSGLKERPGSNETSPYPSYMVRSTKRRYGPRPDSAEAATPHDAAAAAAPAAAPAAAATPAAAAAAPAPSSGGGGLFGFFSGGAAAEPAAAAPSAAPSGGKGRKGAPNLPGPESPGGAASLKGSRPARGSKSPAPARAAARTPTKSAKAAMAAAAKGSKGKAGKAAVPPVPLPEPPKPVSPKSSSRDAPSRYTPLPEGEISAAARRVWQTQARGDLSASAGGASDRPPLTPSAMPPTTAVKSGLSHVKQAMGTYVLSQPPWMPDVDTSAAAEQAASSMRKAEARAADFIEGRGVPFQKLNKLLQIEDDSGRAPLFIRNPGKLSELKATLARLLSYTESSLRLTMEVTSHDIERAISGDEHATALQRLRVRGQRYVRVVDLFFVMLSWLDLLAAFLFSIFSLLLPNVEVPYIYLAAYPAFILAVNLTSAHGTIFEEYQVNDALRELLGQKSDELSQLLSIAALGPETVQLLAAISWRPRGIVLTPECELSLRTSAIISSVVGDVVMVVVNWLYHNRTGHAYDFTSRLLLFINLFSLAVHLPYRIAKVRFANRLTSQEDETSGLYREYAPSPTRKSASPSKRVSLVPDPDVPRRGSTVGDRRRSFSASPDGRRSSSASPDANPAANARRRSIMLARGVEGVTAKGAFSAPPPLVSSDVAADAASRAAEDVNAPLLGEHNRQYSA